MLTAAQPSSSTRARAAATTASRLSAGFAGRVRGLSRTPHPSERRLRRTVFVMNSVRKVLVIGANGATGRAIVTAASAAGHAVTAGVRAPGGPVPPAVGEPLSPAVRVDMRDPGSVRAAVEGQDVVVSAVGPPGRT